MELVANPLARAEFWDFLARTAAILGLGLAVMCLTQIRNIRRMLASTGFKKFLSWLIILPCILLITYSGRLPFLLFVLFMLCAASIELVRLLRIPPFYRKVFAFNQAVTVAVMALRPELIPVLPAVYILCTFVAAGVRNQMMEVVKYVSFCIIASIWTGYFLALLVLLYDSSQGKTLVTVVFGVVIVSDVFAYLIGGIARKTGVGTSPLASNISPNKVIAGLVGNFLGACISFMTFGLRLGWPWWLAATLVVLSGIGAAYGDLAESMVKRSAGVKDSSGLIPHHGGMMDRIDSLLFVAPVFYILLILTGNIAGF